MPVRLGEFCYCVAIDMFAKHARDPRDTFGFGRSSYRGATEQKRISNAS